MFSVVAFSESQDLAGAWGNVAAVPDAHVSTNGDTLYVPSWGTRFLGAIAYVGTLGTNARLRSPHLEGLNPHYIRPLHLALYPADNAPDDLYLNGGPILADGEGLRCEFEANPAAAEQETCVVFLADKIPVPVVGEIVTIEATITLALVAGAWSFSELTLVHDLPTGAYDVVGARAEIDTAVAFRFIPQGGYHRPGAIVNNSFNDSYKNNSFRYGNLGTWLTFDQRNLPGVEVISSAAAASATYDLHLDIIKR